MSKQFSSIRQVAAFTLIELLVVISIISLLMAILLPSLGAARETAMWSNNQANLRQIMLASLYYASDNKDLMMRSNNASNSKWAAVLMQYGYLNSRLIFWSPMRDTRFLYNATYINNFPGAAITLGYAYNENGCGPDASTTSITQRNIAKTRIPHAKLLVFSEQFFPAYYTEANGWRDGQYSLSMSSSANNYFTWKGNAVSCWLDGHVKSASSTELYWNADDSRNGAYKDGNLFISNYFGYGCLPPYYDMRMANNQNLP